jgi:hypothetical protein
VCVVWLVFFIDGRKHKNPFLLPRVIKSISAMDARRCGPPSCFRRESYFLRECISMITEERAAGYLEDVEFDY